MKVLQRSREINRVTCDDSADEIHITLKYRHDTIHVDGKEFPIFDFRHERSWRHLDMWQYKTILEARVPRYRDGDGIKMGGNIIIDTHFYVISLNILIFLFSYIIVKIKNKLHYYSYVVGCAVFVVWLIFDSVRITYK